MSGAQAVEGAPRNAQERTSDLRGDSVRYSTHPERVDPLALLDAKAVAARLGVTSRALRHWRSMGAFPSPIRLGPSGRVLRWRSEDLEAWLEERRAKLTPERPIRIRLSRAVLHAGGDEA